eukprot:7854741-Alexandrium_andersonii.AAC.1
MMAPASAADSSVVAVASPGASVGASSPEKSSGRKVPVLPTRIVKLEAAARTGNPEVDELAKTQHACLESVVDDLLSLPELT